MDTFDKNLGFRAHWTSELIAIHIGGCLAVSGSMDTWRAVTSINSGILISGVYETIPTIKWCSYYIPETKILNNQGTIFIAQFP